VNLDEIEQLAREAVEWDGRASTEWAYSKLRNCIDTTQTGRDGQLYDALEIAVLGDEEPTDRERTELEAAAWMRNNAPRLARAVLAMLPAARAADRYVTAARGEDGDASWKAEESLLRAVDAMRRWVEGK
jgi:hypothetical protein